MNKWNLKLSISEAATNEELITLAENSVLRKIDSINGINTIELQKTVQSMRKQLKYLKSQDSTPEIKKEIKSLYSSIDNVQFVQEYMCLVVDCESDYRRACKGFKINGVTYKRLLGTTGGVKNSTIVFMATDLRGVNYNERIREFIDNGRDMTKELVPGKFEAYKALACSASTPVSNPAGVVVVPDCITHFKSDYIMLDDSCEGEPKATFVKDGDVELNESDGYGLISPALAERWSAELSSSEMLSGFCIRNAFCKGMVFPFDFRLFGSEIAHKSEIVDVWGHKYDINDVELILTESMLKLWDSYESIEDYLAKSYANGYTFAVTKAAPAKLNNVRSLNYQFLQSYELDDEEISELIKPTVDEICGVMGGDVAKAILFLRGENQTAETVLSSSNDVNKALMIAPEIINDPYVKECITKSIKKKIMTAKLGKINVKGDFAIVSGDPYSLCQSIFGLEVTGLLKAGEVYSKYWADKGANEVVCFRAPMSCHNNIRKMKVASTDEMKRWYQYMTTITITNSWDMLAQAENGMDKDGDTMMLTNNDILLRHTLNSPAILCVQRKSQKIIPTEESLIQANLDSFGNPIGAITNRITAMYDIRSQYRPDTEEYKILSYRIMCGQLYQQNAIDKIKGIIATEMPQYWYMKANDKNKFDDEPNYREELVANLKPFFMINRYSDIRSEYRTYVKNSASQCRRIFNCEIADLINKVNSGLNVSEDEKQFLYWYYNKMPVTTGNCLMNRICLKVEEQINSKVARWTCMCKEFSPDIYKSKDVPENTGVKKRLKALYKEYQLDISSLMYKCQCGDIGREVFDESYNRAIKRFEKKCYFACTNKYQLCNALIDICYESQKTISFVWNICGDVIIENLLRQHNNRITFYEQSRNGEIEYYGNLYSKKYVEVNF